ncbi:MAG: PGF-pre-PGF domain-containing protein [Candidatus Aenigmarchaeota archaeon]|nr:PGF-pre-PGF domain-containing protein [Candidatus Aenigmarchaeota archaeon]
MHAICRSASTFCGDSVCDSGETCTSCSGDCGACASSSSSSGGGGGGGGGPSLPSTTETVNSVPANTATTVKITEMKLPVSEVELTTKVTASNVQVTVKEVSAPSGVSAPISSDAGKIYKYIDITASGVDNSQLSKVKIKFKVAKTWFTQNSIEPATVKLSRLVGTAWTKLGTVQTGETAADILYEAETPGLSTFAVTGEKTSTPPSFSACGNNILETGEECDEQQLGGQTCVSKGYASGTLKCGANCKFDTSACVAAGQPPAEKPPEQPAQLPKLPEIPMDKVLIGIGLFALLLVAYYFWIHKKGKHVHVGTEHLQNK